MKTQGPTFALALVAVTALLSASASALEIVLPAETISYRPNDMPGYQAALRNCLICHSAHYVQTQPPSSPRAYWEATVKKMKKPFGAPIAEEDIPALVDYLSKTYGAEQGAVEAKPAAPVEDEKPASRKLLSTIKRVVIRKSILSP